MNVTPEVELSSGAGLPQQVAEHLSAEIREGILKLGVKLPPEAELCKKYGVSRTVISLDTHDHTIFQMHPQQTSSAAIV